ncbi:type II toxin-antitoxin system RelB/DinJ family antitoxin [Spongorhabdus nitratireducens]
MHVRHLQKQSDKDKGITMAKETTVRARIDIELKTEAEEILHQLGLTTSQAINLYFSQIVLQRGLPFGINLPGSEEKDPAE